VKRTEIIHILTIDFSDPADVARHDHMVELVAVQLDQHRLASSGTDHDMGQPARSRPRTGRSTWAWLYDLTEEEIVIVEDAAK